MYAPLPPQYKTPAHLLHFLMCLPTLGLWGIVWGVSTLLASQHNRAEDERYRRERAQGIAVYDAQRQAHDQWLHSQHRWLAGEIRRLMPTPAIRQPFVVDAQPTPGPHRPGRQAPQRRPLASAGPPARLPVPVPQAVPTPRPSPTPREAPVKTDTSGGRHAEAVVETRAMPVVKPTE